MDKVASPQELKGELHRLLASSQEAYPSREKLALELRALADRLGSPVAKERMASEEGDAEKILALFKKNFKYVSVSGHGSGSDVIFEFRIEDGLFKNVANFATALGVDPKTVTLR